MSYRASFYNSCFNTLNKLFDMLRKERIDEEAVCYERFDCDYSYFGTLCIELCIFSTLRFLKDKVTMINIDLLAALLACGLVIYLFIALLKPEILG